MGGLSPLGYDAVEKKLVINEAEAETVRTLFGLYLTFASMTLVKQEADRQGLKTKIRKPNSGQRRGGEPFMRGHLYRLLSNPVYIGEIDHKGMRYAGEHKPIIDQETWAAVQDLLASNAVVRRCRSNAKAPSLLAGLLIDADGNRMRPSHANKAGRRYRYYISTVLTEESADAVDGWRLPARTIEEAVLKGISNLLRNGAHLIEALNLAGSRMKVMLSGAASLADRIHKAGPSKQREILLEMVIRIEVRKDRIRIILQADRLREMIGEGEFDKASKKNEGEFKLDLPVRFRRRGVEMKLIIADGRNQMLAPDPKLIAVVAQGHRWFDEIRQSKAGSIAELAQRCGVDRTDVGRMIPFAFLAPDIVEAILKGRHPVELTAARLRRVRDLPVSWDEQRRLLEFTR